MTAPQPLTYSQFSTGDDDPPDPVEVEDAVKTGLQTGYRHLDCGPVHENEIAVGKGILASEIPRKQIYVTSKLWNTDHDPRGVEPALDRTSRDLGVEFVDLYLVSSRPWMGRRMSEEDKIHWPDSWVKLDPYRWCPGDEKGEPITSDTSIAETWAAMEELVEKGKARSIGVSNFSQVQLEELLVPARTPPAVDQTASNPYRPKRESVDFCRSEVSTPDGCEDWILMLCRTFTLRLGGL